MSVFRVTKNQNYTVMSNYHLRDKNLSLKAKGLLSFMLSLPENWDYSLKGLVQVCKENETAIRNALKELEENNYLERKQIRNEKGLFEYDYYIYEKPRGIEPYIDFPHTDNPYTENQTQINTNQKNTYQQDKLDISINYLTKLLITKDFITETDPELYKYNSFFNDISKENSYTNCIKVINYVTKQMTKLNNIDNKYGYFKKAVTNNLEKLKTKGTPEWFYKDISAEELNEDEQQEMECLLSKYKEGDLTL